ncbi:hypothetical protein AB6A40_009188 [Gnathostoma spinigerum]|uniref:Uncharacterized protein n=1 Tax=Gnathostoma spinigerum TaxID=75299 RepID=A0ABD6EWB3_9BILA
MRSTIVYLLYSFLSTKVGHVDFPQEIERHNKRKRYYPYHLFSTKTLAGITLAISYSLMTNSVVQYGLIFNIDSLSGSIFLNSIYFGACRYFLNIIVAICDYEIKWAGRRLMHAIATIVVITSLLVVLVFILLGIQNDYPLVKRIAIIISVSMGSQIYILNSMAASELFPTVIRNVGNGFIHTCNRIGGILAPQLFLLSAFWLPTPYVVLIAMTFLDVILYLLLVPESKGKALTDYLSHEEKKTLRETLGTQTCLSMGDFRICEIEDEISGSRGDENVTIELDYRKGRGGDEKPVNVHYYHGEAPEEAVYERKADVDGKLSTDERKDEQRLTIIEPRSSEAAKADETPLLQRETKSIGVTAKILQPSELLATLTTKDFGTMTLSINEDKMKETREVGTAMTPSSSLEEVSGGDAENVVTPSGEDLSAGLKLVSTTVTTRTDEMATGVEDLIATMAPNMDDVEGKTKDIGTVMTPAGEDVLTRTKDVETAMTPQIEEIATKAKDIGTAMTPEEEVVLARTKDVETAMIPQVEETVTKAKDVETAMTPGEEVVLARTKDVETAMIPQVEETVTKAKDVETAMTPQGEATKSKDIGTAMTPAQEDLPAGSKDAETAMTPSDEITAATKDVATAMTPRSDEEQMKPEDMESKHSADDEKRPLLS